MKPLEKHRIIGIFIFLITSVPIFGAGWYSSLILKSGENITSCISGGGSIVYAGGAYGSIYSIDISSALPVMKYITGIGAEVRDIIYENGLIYAVNDRFWSIDPASAYSVVIATNNCSYESLAVNSGVFYLSDEYGFLREFDMGSGAITEVGVSALGMTDIAYHDGAVFAVSRDRCLYRFYETAGEWSREKIYNAGTKLYSITVSSFSGAKRLYIGGADSYLREVYYDKGWKIFPVDYTSGAVNDILTADISGTPAIYLYNDGGGWYEFSVSTSGYVKENIFNYGAKINTALAVGATFYFFTDDSYMSALYYSPVILPGAGYKHQPSGELSADASISTYRNPVFPKKDEEIKFYFTDSSGSDALLPALYWKQSSSSTWQTSSFDYKEQGNDYSVYFTSLTLSFSTGTIVEYFIAANGVYISRPGEDGLANNSNYAFGYSSASAASKPFTFMLAGTGNCFHAPASPFGDLSSMRFPLNPIIDTEITFYIGNQASGVGNYGNMNGGAFHYYQAGEWEQQNISWSEDIGDYKYWKSALTLSTTMYYFSVTYDDHNTTYVYGDENNSYTSDFENDAKSSPFVLAFSTVSFNINLYPAPENNMTLSIYEANTFILAYESAISSFSAVSLYPGDFELIIKGGNYKTVYKNISFPSDSKNYSLFYATTPRSFTVTGNCEGNFSEGELIGADSENDSSWGANNEIHSLWATYSQDDLYLGLKGILGNNSIVLYLDCGDYYGSISDSSALPWSQARNHKFPAGFKPDYQFSFWNFTAGSFYRISSSYTLVDVTGNITQAIKAGGSEKTGSIELRIPFSVLYDGLTGFGVPHAAEIKLLVAVTGGDGTSAKDTVPDQGSSFGGTFDEFTFDRYFVIPLDSDADGVPDEGKYIADIAYSTVGVLSSQSAAVSQSIAYVNFNAAEYFYRERDMPLSIYSIDADSAVLKWKNSALSVYSTLYPSSVSASTFTFIVPSEHVFDSIDYYFVLYRGTESQNTAVYNISVKPDITFAPGSREYSVGDSKIVFDVPLEDSARLLFLEPESLITDNIVPSNSEIISTAAIRLPLELYEITGAIPPATVTLAYFNEEYESAYAAYFYDGINWVYKPSSVDTSGNKITFSLNQPGKIGVFRITSASLPSGKNISSISKPVFNPGMGEKIEFNFIQNPSSISIEIFDMNGRKIKKLSGETGWNGIDGNNNVVPTGAYLYHMKTDVDDFWGTLGIWK